MSTRSVKIEIRTVILTSSEVFLQRTFYSKPETSNFSNKSETLTFYNRSFPFIFTSFIMVSTSKACSKPLTKAAECLQSVSLSRFSSELWDEV